VGRGSGEEGVRRERGGENRLERTKTVTFNFHPAFQPHTPLLLLLPLSRPESTRPHTLWPCAFATLTNTKHKTQKMCWNREVSAVLAVAGAAAAWTQYKWGRPKGRIIFFSYWALIEVLQLAQYAVIDQCSNPVNKVRMERRTKKKNAASLRPNCGAMRLLEGALPES